MEHTEKTRQKSVVREYVEAILVALVLALFIRTFVVQAFKIPSGSMIPTLLVGDHLLVNKFTYGIKNPFTDSTWVSLGEPQPHDIIVFKFPKDPSTDFIKRVIGVAGDRVEIIDKKVYVNGEPFVEPNAVFLENYVAPGKLFIEPRAVFLEAPGSRQSRDNFGPVIVPQGSLFVMGDNRDNSRDSRYWGFVDLKAVKGKAFMLYWSWDRDKFSVRWDRLGNMIH